MSFSYRDFQEIKFWAADDTLDAKGSTGEREVIPIPSQLESISVLEFGYILQADTAASAVMTTRGRVVLLKIAIADGSSTEMSSVLMPYSKKKGYNAKSGSLNTVTPSGGIGSSVYDSPPAFPSVNLSTHYLRVDIATQGVGGDQLVKPYVIYKVKPRSLNDI